MQDGRPLAFTRKQLSERHLGQSIYEKEMLSILQDLWHPYLLGQCFQIKIDHQSLKYFLEQMNFITRATKMGDQDIWL
jgi:hypothetical protein